MYGEQNKSFHESWPFLTNSFNSETGDIETCNSHYFRTPEVTKSVGSVFNSYWMMLSRGCQFRITEAWRQKEANECHGVVNLFLINSCWTGAISTKCIMAPNEVILKGFSACRYVVKPTNAISCNFSKVPLFMNCRWRKYKAVQIWPGLICV